MKENDKESTIPPGGWTEWLEGKAQTPNMAEVLETIMTNFPVRNVGEEIEKLIKDKNEKLSKDKKITTAKLNKDLGISNFSAYLTGWKNGKLVSREMAIKLAFALGIKGYEAQTFIMNTCWEDDFHMRDYKDIIYRFCLDHGYNYADACGLINEFPGLDRYNPDAQDLTDSEGLTQFLAKKYNAISTKNDLDDLRKFISDNKERLGCFNRTAYKEFVDLYESLVDSARERDNQIMASVAENLPELLKRKDFNDIFSVNDLRQFLEENTDCVDDIDVALKCIISDLFYERIAYNGKTSIEQIETEDSISKLVSKLIETKSLNDISTPNDLRPFLEKFLKEEKNRKEIKKCFDNITIDVLYNRVKSDLFKTVGIIYNGKASINVHKSNKAKPLPFEEICKRAAMGIPGKVERKTASLIQRMLVRDIPNRQAFSAIYNKDVNEKDGSIRQVPRKYLILLYMLNFESIDFEESVIGLNDLLERCGMSLLDTRNPFDWLVMHSFYFATDESGEDSSAMARINELAENMFGNE